MMCCQDVALTNWGVQTSEETCRGLEAALRLWKLKLSYAAKLMGSISPDR